MTRPGPPLVRRSHLVWMSRLQCGQKHHGYGAGPHLEGWGSVHLILGLTPV